MPEKFNKRFWRWFGGSKVVDGRGDPLVVYHGTGRYFTAFAKEMIGSTFRYLDTAVGTPFFFTDNPEFASFIARNHGALEGENIKPVFLSFQKPLIKRTSWISTVDVADFIGEALNKNSDSLIVHCKKKMACQESTGSFYVAFDPIQIKSAIGNDGTWDIDDPDIRSNPENKIEFLPYITSGMKAVLLKKAGLVAWKTNSRGDPHHEVVVEEYFPGDTIIAKAGRDSHGTVYVAAELARDQFKAIDVAALILPEFMWDDIYDDDDFILDWGYKPSTQTYEASESMRIRDLPQLGFKKRMGHNPRKRSR